MAEGLHRFPLLRKYKAHIRPVERRIGPVYGAVVIRADEHHVVQRVIAATAQPVYMMRFAEFLLV